MALILKKQHRSHGVTWKSGYIYSFRYQSWQNDPTPTYIHMYSINGINPSTGHQWRLNQGINFTYIPRNYRKLFASFWVKEMEVNRGNVQFTWQRVKTQFPYLQTAVRRYFLKPSYFISKVIEIPLEDMEQVVIATWSKDFSKKVKQDLNRKYKQATGPGRRKTQQDFKNMMGRRAFSRR